MANNRMFLVNRSTGLSICIAKHFGGGWFVQPGFTIEELAEFLSAEMDAPIYAGVPTTAWEIEFESRTDWNKQHDAKVREDVLADLEGDTSPTGVRHRAVIERKSGEQ